MNHTIREDEYGTTTDAASAANREASVSLTPGLLKALTVKGVYHVCDCGMPIPKYTGRYPKFCPFCNRPLDVNQDGQPDRDELPV